MRDGAVTAGGIFVKRRSERLCSTRQPGTPTVRQFAKYDGHWILPCRRFMIERESATFLLTLSERISIMASSNGWCGITRRGFLLGAAGGLAAGLPAAWFGRDLLQRLRLDPQASSLTALSPVTTPASSSMPGPYPGRVIEVRHPHAVSSAFNINPAAVDGMIDRGMAMLTGAEPGDVRGAWGRFFEKGQVVGIKVNPVGRKPLPGERKSNPNAIGSISNPAVVVKIVKCLREVGLRPQDIIIFERYAKEFRRGWLSEIGGARATGRALVRLSVQLHRHAG